VSTEHVLAITGLTKSYGRLKVLDGVTLNLDAGSVVVLLGANGAGKTTTFRCILGTTDFRGQIEVAGRSVAKEGKAVRGLVGYLPQTPGFAAEDTCSEALRFLAQLRRVPVDKVAPLLEKVNLAAQRDVRVRELSGGMRQRLALAAALLSDPPLLLLDEPTANLDHESRRELHDLLIQLRGEGRTIVLSTHFVEHIADIADRLILLKDGRVVLDEDTLSLSTQGGRKFTVHLNGTAPESFFTALRNAGIAEDHVSVARTDLQEVIARALAAGEAES
jgi:ABC-type multidrug transport system ATPase subunit